MKWLAGAAGLVALGALAPPEPAEELGHWEDAELFWITKHGIRMAGMTAPAGAAGGAEYRSLSGREGGRASRPGSGHGLGDHGESGHSH